MLGQADDVWAWCDRARAFGRTGTVKVKYADFRQITRSRSRSAPVATRDDLRAASLDLIRSVLPAPAGIRLVGVTVSNFAAVDSDVSLPLLAVA